MIKHNIFTEDMKDITPKISQRSDGKYRCRVSVSFNTDTKKYTYKEIYGNDRNEVLMKRNEFIDEQIRASRGITPGTGDIVEEMENWLYREKFRSVRSTSFDRLEGIYKNQILPALDNIRHHKVKQMTCDDVKDIVNEAIDLGYSYSTCLKVYRVLHEFFEYEVNNEKIIKSPFGAFKMYKKAIVLERQKTVKERKKTVEEKNENGEKLSKYEEMLLHSSLKMEDKEEIQILTDEEIAKIKDVVYNGYNLQKQRKDGTYAVYKTQYLIQAEYFIFLMNCGLRLGEAISLKYSDVDFKKNTIAIHENAVMTKNRDKDGHIIQNKENSVEKSTKLKIQAPKTANSKTVIQISDTAISILKKMKEKERPSYSGYIIHDESFKIITPRNFRKRWNTLLNRAGIEKSYGLHALRHTFASKVYAQTHDMKLVSELVRHSDVAFTAKTYIHLVKEETDQTVAKLTV